LIEAAGPIFAQKGFQAATVREICRKARVNLAAINYYFGGKEQLYRQTVAAAHPTKFAHPAQQFNWPPGTPPQQKLRDFIRTMLERMLQLDPHSWQEELLLREVLSPTPICHPMIRRHFRAGMEILESICRELLPQDVPEQVLVRTMLSIVGQCVYYRVARKALILVLGSERFQELFSLEKLVEHVTAFSLAALGHGPPVPEWSGSQQTVGQRKSSARQEQSTVATLTAELLGGPINSAGSAKAEHEWVETSESAASNPSTRIEEAGCADSHFGYSQ
jgi:AcrR family transcriptional regulator